MNVSFWTELLIDKCSCLSKDPNNVSRLIIKKECELQNSCSFKSIRQLLLQEDPPQPLELITALAVTSIFTEKQIKKICTSVFNFKSLQIYRYYKNFLKYVNANNLCITEDSNKIIHLKKNNFIV